MNLGYKALEILDRIVNKVMSGKFVLAVIAGYTFQYAARHNILSKETIGVIITAVFLSYFRKKEV